MTEQLQIDWSVRAHARRDNLQTSKAAAASMQVAAQSLAGRVLASLRAQGPATASELSRRLELTQYQTGKRISDLRNANMIEASEETRPGPSGRAQTVWRVLQI